MIVPPRFAAYPQCEDALWRNVQRAMIGEVPPADAVAARRRRDPRASSPPPVPVRAREQV